jgi:hypothetical protein
MEQMNTVTEHETGAARQQNPDATRQPIQESQPFALPVVLVGLAGAALLITAGGHTFGLTGWWAFVFLDYAPLGLRWAAGAAIVLTATPLAYAWWLRYAARVEQGLRRWALPLWLALPLALVGFWRLRERTWHGDALYKVALLESTPLRDNPYIWKEPLDSLLEYGMTAAVRPLGLGPDSAIAFMSVLAGGVFVAATWAAASWLTVRALRRVAIAAALLASGASLLWFGHVENYSGSTALAFATIVLAVGALQNRAPLWAVGVTGGAAVSLHPQAAFVLPALLVLLRRDRWPRQVTALTLSGLVAPVATVLMLGWLGAPLPALNGGFAGDPQLFWTPLQALAPAQLADALQNLWLIAPLWPFWIGGGAVGMVKLWSEGQGARGEARRTLLLLSVAAAGMLCYFFAFQNDLPRPRDWDLFAIVGPPLTLWGVYTWLYLIDRAPTPRVAATLRQMLIVGLIFASCYTMGWIGVNHVYTLLRPDAAERERLARYRLLDLTELLPQATITPDAPICAEPVGCERVALTEFTMPQSGDTRPVIFAHAPAEIAIPLTVPTERSFLWLSPALDPQTWAWGGDGVTFAVRVRDATGERTLWERHITPADPADRGWQEVFAPLDDYRGQPVTVVLVTDPGPAGSDAADRAGWGMPWLMRGTVARDE